MFACFSKKTSTSVIADEVYEAEIELLQWQRNAEDAESAAKKMRVNVETVKLRLKRLRAQLEEAKKSMPKGADMPLESLGRG